MLSLEVSPQRLCVSYSKEKVVAAVEEPREHSSTNPSKWTSPPPRHVGLLTSDSRVGYQERHNLVARVRGPEVHSSDLNVRVLGEPQASALQLKKVRITEDEEVGENVPDQRRPSKHDQHDQLDQRKHRCNLHRWGIYVWIVNYTAL